MFPKAAIKRYYDNVSVGPGPWTYDPKLDQSLGRGTLNLSGQRFSDSSAEFFARTNASNALESQRAKNSFYKCVNRSTCSKIPVLASNSSFGSDSSVFKTPPSKLDKARTAKIRRSGSASQLDTRIKSDKTYYEMNMLKSKVQEMNFGMEKAMTDRNSLEEEIQELQSRFKVLNMNLTSTLSDKLSLESKCSSLEANFLKITGESDALLNEVNEKLVLETKKAQDSQRLLTENLNALEEKDQLMKEIKLEKDGLKNQKSTIENSLSSLQNELSSFQLKSEEEKKSLQTTITEKEKTIEELIESERDLNETYLILKQRLKEVESQIEEYKTAESLHLEFKSVNEELSQALVDMEARYSEKVKLVADSEKERLEKDNATLNAENVEMKKKIQECQHDWKTKYEVLLLRFEKSETTIQKLNIELLDKAQKLSEMKEVDKEDPASKAQIKLLNDMISSLKKELEETNDRLGEKSIEFDECARQYEALKTMIAPFRDQLEQYEIEKSALLSQNKEAQGEIKKVTEALGQKLGHQNHKQKIQIMVRLKQENVDLKLALRKAETEVAHLKKKQGLSENDRCVESKLTRNTSVSSPLRNRFHSLLTHRLKTTLMVSIRIKLVYLVLFGLIKPFRSQEVEVTRRRIDPERSSRFGGEEVFYRGGRFNDEFRRTSRMEEMAPFRDALNCETGRCDERRREEIGAVERREESNFRWLDDEKSLRREEYIEGRKEATERRLDSPRREIDESRRREETVSRINRDDRRRDSENRREETVSRINRDDRRRDSENRREDGSTPRRLDRSERRQTTRVVESSSIHKINKVSKYLSVSNLMALGAILMAVENRKNILCEP